MTKNQDMKKQKLQGTLALFRSSDRSDIVIPYFNLLNMWDIQATSCYSPFQQALS